MNKAELFDPYHPGISGLLENPYPIYAQLREKAPVHWSPTMRLWQLTGYSHVLAAFRHPMLSNATRLGRMLGSFTPEQQQILLPLREALSTWAVFKDAEDHRRVRALINPSFTPIRIHSWEFHIRQTAKKLLEDVRESGTLDLVKDVANPLPVLVIAEILGVPSKDHVLLKQWSDDLAGFLAAFRCSMDTALKAQTSVLQMQQYMLDLISSRRLSPSNDLISTLIEAKENGSRLSDKEIAATTMMLLFGGHETTTNLIGNGMLALLEHPQQLEKLCKDLSLLPSAVEECLRYDTPAQWLGRRALEDLKIGNKWIAKGESVLLMMGAANRDPEKFNEPDTFDISRTENRHLAFGQGAHFCVGAELARMEAKVVFELLLSQFKGLRKAETKLKWLATPGFRGLQSLRLEWESAKLR